MGLMDDDMPGLPAPGPESSPSPEGGGSSELEMHAGTFAKAVQRGDKKAIATAFRAMKQACDAEGYDDGPSDLDV